MTTHNEIYAYDTSSVKVGILTFREEHQQRIFENILLRDIFGYMRGEVKRLEKLIIGELRDFYPS
jgi:hypothetical protein